jgi:pyridoxal phosphate enzyme (YggS family)
MASVADRLHEVRARIAAAERASGRAPGSVTLVAVSKTKPVEAIEEAYAAGQRDFGENYAQEFERKAKALAHLPDLRWHFIGHLQRNKAKIVAEHAHTFHTLDTPALALELQKRLTAANRTLDVLAEVNVSREVQKHGATPAALRALLEACIPLTRLVLRGFMTVPPADDDLATEAAFRALADLAHQHAASFPSSALLSMGMSDDLAIAIACGATHVRIGTAIFGARANVAAAPEDAPSEQNLRMLSPREDS